MRHIVQGLHVANGYLSYNEAVYSWISHRLLAYAYLTKNNPSICRLQVSMCVMYGVASYKGDK